MKKIIYLVLLLPLFSMAQIVDTNWENDSAKVFTRYEIDPVYNGGAYGWRKFLQQNISEKSILENLTDDRHDSVAVKFIVTKEGTIESISTLYSSNDSLAKELVRLLKLSSGNWSPPVNGSRQINGWYSMWLVGDVSGAKGDLVLMTWKTRGVGWFFLDR